MTTVVGIFDDAGNMDQAVEQLAAAKLDCTVYDESTAAAESGTVGEIRSVLPPGAAPAKGATNDVTSMPTAPDQHTQAEDFKATLEDFGLSTEVREAYARTFRHKGKFVFVRTDSEHADQAMGILRSCGASVVDRHG
jgi:hypothetical protein